MPSGGEDRFDWGRITAYYDLVNRRTWADWRQHFYGQVGVSLLIAVLAGLIALVLGFGLGSLVVGVAAPVLWLLLALAAYRVRAPAAIHAETTTELHALAYEKAERETIRFDITTMEPEFTGRVLQRDGRLYKLGTFLFLVVRNLEGLPARFSVSYRNVSGVGPRPNETWHGLAWEDYPTRTAEIGYHGLERVLAIECFREPRCLWFHLPQSAAWGGTESGKHALSPPVKVTGDVVEFDVHVVNQSETKDIYKRARITFGDDSAVETFTLADLSERSS